MGKDVDKFVAMIEEQLPRSSEPYMWSTFEALLMRSRLREPDLSPTIHGNFQPLLNAKETEIRESYQDLADRKAELRILLRRVTRVNPEAEYWRRLKRSFVMLMISYEAVAEHQLNDSSDDIVQLQERWEEAWSEVGKQRQVLLDRINEIALPIPMNPPPNGRRRRIARHARSIIDKAMSPVAPRGPML